MQDVSRPTPNPRSTKPQWRLCVLISEALCPAGDWLAVAEAITSAKARHRKADCIQLREKTTDDHELLRRAQQLVSLCRPRGVAIVINDRPDIALLARADGVHLGQDDLPCARVRELVSDKLLIGVSTANLDQAQRALKDDADYCGVGPMFPTTTKDKPTIAGVDYLQQYLAWGKLPHLAIGGITPANTTQLVDAGARGVAVSSAVCSASDPQAAVDELLGTLSG